MEINELSVAAIRALSIDGVNKANSGHPGIDLGAAPMLHVLYSKFINASPKDSHWLGRDRFVLASGHGSMLLYSMLHVCGYKISMDDLKSFRQLGSITPGHPEIYTDGVDCASGPLGQGSAHAVGFAIAEKFMAETFNKEDIKLFDNYTYALCGDGDMEEGVGQEAFSLAGSLHLNKLIVLCDSNDVTLDGPLSKSNCEDYKKRMEANGWNVMIVDGFDLKAIEKAIKKAQKSTDKPTFIICKTIIGYGSAKQGLCDTHGSPLGIEDGLHAKESYGYNYPEFTVPEEVYKLYEETFQRRGKRALNKWKNSLKEYKNKYPEDYAKLMAALDGSNIKDIKYPKFEVSNADATRVTSGKIINEIANQLPNFIGGASDVAKSVNTLIKSSGQFGVDEHGRNIYFGIREFAMSCAQTGMLLYGGIRPYLGCFLVFSDYLKPSIRTAAIMKVPSINVFTHDSIAVGEDGATHQPIEQVSTLRLIPNCVTFRPDSAIETSHAWRYALENKEGPVNIICTRQGIKSPVDVEYETFKKGAYIVRKENKEADYIVIATGSEVEVACEIANRMQDKYDIRVVSMPSMELFEKQSKKYKHEIIGGNRNKVIALEMEASGLWYKYASKVIGIDTFGESGKGNDVIKHYGFDVDSLIKRMF